MSSFHPGTPFNCPQREKSDRLLRYSGWTVDQSLDQNNDEHRHVIDFAETTETGFWHLDTEQLAYLKPWQFQVGAEESRVAGFIVDDTFYIVWLDYNHALYTRQPRPRE